jgi:hypothetical protein
MIQLKVTWWKNKRKKYLGKGKINKKEETNFKHL